MHVLFNLQVFEDFLTVLLFLICSLIPLWSQCIHCMISILLNLLKYAVRPRISWWMFHVSLRITCILLLLGKVLYICQLDPINDDSGQFNYVLLTFCLLDLSITHSGKLKSPTIIVDLSISPCNSVLPHIFEVSVIRCVQI